MALIKINTGTGTGGEHLLGTLRNNGGGRFAGEGEFLIKSHAVNVCGVGALSTSVMAQISLT